MDTVPKVSSATQLYESDFHAWCMEQAELLRAQGRSIGENHLDFENLAEEIESLGRSTKRELKSRIIILLAHLLKWRHQRELRGRSWRVTIGLQRDEIEELLRENPSLREFAREAVVDVYARAVREAARETGVERLALPAACPFAEDDVFDAAFFPSDLDV